LSYCNKLHFLCQVQYSQDGLHWITLTEDTQPTVPAADRIFPANYDADTVVRQMFGRRLEAKALRIRPLKWHGAIGLRLEVLGCFQPYNMPYMPTFFPSIMEENRTNIEDGNASLEVPHAGASLEVPYGGASPEVPQEGTSPEVPHEGATPEVPHEGASPDVPYKGVSPEVLHVGASPEVGTVGPDVQCGVCPGVLQSADPSRQREKYEVCPCPRGLFWSSEGCVELGHCSCLMGQIR
jgi:hypothetical protein